MSKVITFSRFFPSTHPRKGEPTYFVEKVLTSVHPKVSYHIENIADLVGNNLPLPLSIDELLNHEVWGNCKPKFHTIRAGNRWKVGDYFSPRVWSGKPYQSKQIILAPDIEIKKVWDFEIKMAYKELPLDYDTYIIIDHRFYHTDDEIMKQLSQNDGLSLAELLQWFKYPKEFRGQILCWSNEVNY